MKRHTGLKQCMESYTKLKKIFKTMQKVSYQIETKYGELYYADEKKKQWMKFLARLKQNIESH